MRLRTTDAEGLTEGDTVTIRGTDYTVRRLEPDGTGMTRVELMRPPVDPATQDGWRAWR